MSDDTYIEISEEDLYDNKILAHTPDDPQQRRIIWEAPEYIHEKKDPNWYWALGIISVGLVVISIFLKNPLFAIIIVIGAFTIGLFAARKPDNVEFEITTTGIRANNQLYIFDSLKSFRIVEFEDGAQLLLKSKKAIMPVTVLILPQDAVDIVRNQLLFTLNEEDISESVAQTIFNRLGF